MLRPLLPLLFTAVAAAAAAPPPAAGRAGPLDITPEGPGFVEDEYVHLAYTFTLTRSDMHRQGAGELWLAFENDLPRLKLQGHAASPTFGKGEVTLVVDASSRLMHVTFKLGDLHEQQCLTYPFPEVADEPSLMERLRWRKDQVDRWQVSKAMAGLSGLSDGAEAALPSMNWTKSYRLEFMVDGSGKEVRGVYFKAPDRIIKSVFLDEVLESGSGTFSQHVPPGTFDAPAACVSASEVLYPMAKVELIPPYRRSSALNDLLLVLADRGSGGVWSRLFVTLSALVVPGDVAVMIEEPSVPPFDNLHGVGFDYQATVFRLGVTPLQFDDPAADMNQQTNRHRSEGSIEVDLDGRRLRLTGEAQQTKVGPLVMDLVVDAPKGQIFANVDLKEQLSRQCVAYDYPPLDLLDEQELRSVASQFMTFKRVAEIDHEDCGEFVAPLAHEHWIYVYVDLESDRLDAILRVEVRKGGLILRRVDVTRWHTDEERGQFMNAVRTWGCQHVLPTGTEQLAHLGLRRAEHWSLELQDVLHSLRDMGAEFVLLEALSLAGDVAIMVNEPKAPDFSGLQEVTFAYNMTTSQQLGGGLVCTIGTFAVELAQQTELLLSVHTLPQNADLSLSLAGGEVAIRRQDGEVLSCLTTPLKGSVFLAAPDDSSTGTFSRFAAVFDGVERVHGVECNRFTYSGTPIVRLWYSVEDGAVHRIELLPLLGDQTSLAAFIDVTDWHSGKGVIDALSSSGQVSEGGEIDTALCGHTSISDMAALLFGPALPLPGGGTAQDRLPATLGLMGLSQAVQTIGLLPGDFGMLPRLAEVPAPTSTTTTTPPPVNIFGPDLTAFSMSFTSTHSETNGLKHVGSGHLQVDFRTRRLALISQAERISEGLLRVQSRSVFLGEESRLHVQTSVDGRETTSSITQCWSLDGTAVAERQRAWAANPMGSNPLSRAVPKPGAPGTYMLFLEHGRVVELVPTADRMALRFMSVVESTGIVTSISVHFWSSGVPAAADFVAEDGSQCSSLSYRDGGSAVGGWDLLNVFFPAPTPDLMMPGPVILPPAANSAENPSADPATVVVNPAPVRGLQI